VRTEQFAAELEGELERRGMPNGAAANNNGKKENLSPLIITMDQVKAEKVDWLWINRIPIGRITLLDGDPGSGKSTLSLVIASAVSRALRYPSGKSLKPLRMCF
jgi:predicted ATP-dependent serine protease